MVLYIRTTEIETGKGPRNFGSITVWSNIGSKIESILGIYEGTVEGLVHSRGRLLLISEVLLHLFDVGPI